MLLLFDAAPVVAYHHHLLDLLSPDKLFDAAQHLLIDVLPKIVIITTLAWVLIRVLTYFTDRMARMAEKHAAPATRISQARTLSSVLRVFTVNGPVALDGNAHASKDGKEAAGSPDPTIMRVPESNPFTGEGL